MILAFCDKSYIVQVLLIIKIFFKIACILVPIVIAISSIITFTKAIQTGDEADLKTGGQLLVKRLIAGLIILFLPALISAFINNIDGAKEIDFLACFDSASKEKVASLKAKEEAEAKAEAATQDKEDEKTLREAYEKEMKEKGARQQSYEEWKKNRQTTNNNGGGSGEIRSSGTSGTYFAPLQDASYTITGASQTAGCGNAGAVKHDARVAEGTKIYAAFDGTVQYIQNVCGNELYSYGNQARLTDPNTNTYIIYAHLSRFEGIDTPGIVTCPKNGSSDGPCPYHQCPTSIERKIILTKSVVKGEVIGYTGDTGNSISPHLHVEIHENGSSNCVEDPWSAFGMH